MTQNPVRSLAYQLILHAYEQFRKKHGVPEQIVVSQEMYDQFVADVQSTGHNATIWCVPVVPGDVPYISFAGGKPKRRWYSLAGLIRYPFGQHAPTHGRVP